MKRIIDSEVCYEGTVPNNCGNPPRDDTGVQITTNPQAGNANGQVYNVDAPGFYGPGTTFSSTPLRLRVNFEAYAVGPDGKIPISPKIYYYVRISCISNSKGTALFSYDAGGTDNQINSGTTPTTWNLK